VFSDSSNRPPALPPHLRHIILNKPAPTIDPQSLPVPQYVSLNHLYCTAIKDGMMVLGATQRYREKYFTIVFYSVMPQSGTQYSSSNPPPPAAAPAPAPISSNISNLNSNTPASNNVNS
jgi:hypothetical protein